MVSLYLMQPMFSDLNSTFVYVQIVQTKILYNCLIIETLCIPTNSSKISLPCQEYDSYIAEIVQRVLSFWYCFFGLILVVNGVRC